jgi:hypothetical protein
VPADTDASVGLRAALARARRLDAALLDVASCGYLPLWYATLPTPRPDGRRVIGGWKTEKAARYVLESLGYRVVRDTPSGTD